MRRQELREQAERWRARAPGYDEPTAQALIEAAQSLEGLAHEKETVLRAAARAFLHRAYER